MTYRIRPAERRDVAALAALAEAQAATRRTLDPRLSQGAQLIPFLSEAHTLSEVLSWRQHATLVAARNDCLIGGINLHKVEQHDHDQFASYYPRRFTSIGLLTTQDEAPAHVLSDLLSCASEQAVRWKAPWLLAHNASADRPMHEALRSFGFRPYYHFALRAPETPTPALPRSNPHPNPPPSSFDSARHPSTSTSAGAGSVSAQEAGFAQDAPTGDGESAPLSRLPCGMQRMGSVLLRTACPAGFIPIKGTYAGCEGLGVGVHVRHATRRDLDEVVRIGMQSVYYHAGLESTLEVARGEARKMRRRFEQALNEPAYSTILIAESAQVLGFYSLYIQDVNDTWSPPLFAAGRYGLIAEVAVEEKFRGQGIGRAIFAEAEKWFRARAVNSYWLIYLPHNPLSSKFWPSLGFEPVWEVMLKDEG